MGRRSLTGRGSDWNVGDRIGAVRLTPLSPCFDFTAQMGELEAGEAGKIQLTSSWRTA